jgi:hypothetical protein
MIGPIGFALKYGENSKKSLTNGTPLCILFTNRNWDSVGLNSGSARGVAPVSPSVKNVLQLSIRRHGRDKWHQCTLSPFEGVAGGTRRTDAGAVHHPITTSFSEGEVMSRNVRRFRALVLAVAGIVAINWAVAYSSGAPSSMQGWPKPKSSGAPSSMQGWPKPKTSGAPSSMQGWPKPKTSGAPSSMQGWPKP